ncbi:MAG: hypothetical protein GXP62_14270, partial [Oligoflexia bacterium]|nr:hypothetical protein [Oligoflexia bacterium]
MSPRCDLSLGSPTPSLSLPGDTVSLPATPLTSTWDTAVIVGGHRATVIDVVRDGCDPCDSCRADYGCSVCGDCDACDLECDTDCIETVEFQVPSTLSAGTWDTWVYNVHGAGGPLPLVVGSVKDTGSKDSGAKDSGAKDSGA